MGIKVLSLFDGGSCGQVALKNLGFEIDVYYASEIEKNAIKITMKNHPNTVQIGNVENVSYDNGILKTENGDFEVGKIDLLIGGSPCQDLSRFKSKEGEGLNGKKSKLYFEYERVLKEVNPTYFMLENVQMNKISEDLISNNLNVKPYKINSNTVSAQDRVRLYWTNIPFDESPFEKESNIMFKDIKEKDVDEKYYLYDNFANELNLEKRVVVNLEQFKENGKRKYMESGTRIYNENFKMATLTCIGGGGQHKKIYDIERNLPRNLTPIEYERLQMLPDNYTEGVAAQHRYSICGNGWTVGVIEHIFKGLPDEYKN